MRGRPLGRRERKIGSALGRIGYGWGRQTLQRWGQHQQVEVNELSKEQSPSCERLLERRRRLENRSQLLYLVVLITPHDRILRKRIRPLPCLDSRLRPLLHRRRYKDREILERLPERLLTSGSAEQMRREHGRGADEVCNFVIPAPIELRDDLV